MSRNSPLPGKILIWIKCPFEGCFCGVRGGGCHPKYFSNISEREVKSNGKWRPKMGNERRRKRRKKKVNKYLKKFVKIFKNQMVAGLSIYYFYGLRNFCPERVTEDQSFSF